MFSALALSHPTRHTPGGVDPSPHRRRSSLRRERWPEAPGGASGFFSPVVCCSSVTIRRSTSLAAMFTLKGRRVACRRVFRDPDVVQCVLAAVRSVMAGSSTVRARPVYAHIAMARPQANSATSRFVSASNADAAVVAEHRNRVSYPTTGRHGNQRKRSASRRSRNQNRNRNRNRTDAKGNSRQNKNHRDRRAAPGRGSNRRLVRCRKRNSGPWKCWRTRLDRSAAPSTPTFVLVS